MTVIRASPRIEGAEDMWLERVIVNPVCMRVDALSSFRNESN
jgi:hypothetical protein